MNNNKLADRKLVIIHNPKAGGGKSKAVLRDFICYADQKGCRDYTVYSTSCKKDYNGIRRALQIPHDRTVIIGGDGTINDCINAIEQHETERMLIIPSGSGNDFSGSLYQKKRSAKDYFDLCETDSFEMVDVGVCNGIKFINGLGIGFDSQVARWSEKKLLKFLGPSLRYHIPVYAGILFYRSKRVRVTVGQQAQKALVNFMLSIGNGERLGGGYRLTPGAKINDGLLNLASIDKINVLSRMRHLTKVKKGTHVHLPFVELSTLSSILIEYESPVTAHVDGELISAAQFAISIHSSPVYFAREA